MLQHLPISSAFETTFITLQALVVAFLLFHDWIPIGRLNNLAAIRGEDTLPRRVFRDPPACRARGHWPVLQRETFRAYPTRTGLRCCFGSLMAFWLSASSVPGGYPTWFCRTQSEPPAIKLSSPARTRSCPVAMAWPRTPTYPVSSGHAGNAGRPFHEDRIVGHG